MDRIVLEVDQEVSSAYRKLSRQNQQKLLEAFSIILKKAANDASQVEYKKLLDDWGATAIKNGLTQDVLNELLKEHD